MESAIIREEEKVPKKERRTNGAGFFGQHALLWRDLQRVTLIMDRHVLRHVLVTLHEWQNGTDR
jgi:hypothetical protein